MFSFQILFFLHTISVHDGLNKQELQEKLNQRPDTFEDLKSILGTISDIRDMSLDVEIRFADIKERYRMMAMYKYKVLC